MTTQDFISSCMPFRVLEIPSSGSQVIMCDAEPLKMLLTVKEKSETMTQTSLSGSKSIRELKIMITLKRM